ncbi:hypothetical protein [Pseudomonas mohnii]|uniref:hypothetical protein n=1 Tax=Pseudomonas mohnii TaxID=395600 RepID=UPI0018DC4B7F|nr:hypothetical protein [Pseudomonas mohnii]MBH8611359.1 hypothetical protein [Pseudomonas mohnii]
MRAILERSHPDGRNAVDADAIPHLLEAVDPQQGVAVDIAPGSLIAFSGGARLSTAAKPLVMDSRLSGVPVCSLHAANAQDK